MKKISILLFSALLIASCCNQKTEEVKVKNVIYMIGDGMGVAQVTALMIDDKYEPINMERAQYVGLVKTYSANNRVTDSAAAGTALATGTKTNNSHLGVDPEKNHLKSVLTKAQEDGYNAGLVVTCILPHATPGAFYGHVSHRSQYDSIAVQLLESDIDVFLGGGRKYFNDREDGRNLLEEFSAKGYQIFEQFSDVDVSSGKVAGLFAEKDMPMIYQREENYLPNATAKAMEILNNNSDKGFFLMVEGSFIDYAGHGNNAVDLLGEMRDFDNAVGRAFDFADKNPGTLVVVLADHETGGLTIPSGNSDFTTPESGIEYRFSSGSHTGVMIPMFAYGTGAENFAGVFDNTDIPKIIEKLMLGNQQ